MRVNIEVWGDEMKILKIEVNFLCSDELFRDRGDFLKRGQSFYQDKYEFYQV